MADEDALDRGALSQLLELVGGETTDLADLIETFLEESLVLMEELRTAVETSRREAVRRASHSLKSNARDLGALRLSLCCAGLERDPDGMPDATGRRLAEIEAEYATARGALEGLLRAYRG